MTHAMTTEITRKSHNTTLTPDEPESSTNGSATSSSPGSPELKSSPASSPSSGSNAQSQNGESDAARAALIRLLHTIADIVQSIGDPIPTDQIPTVSMNDILEWLTLPALVAAGDRLMETRQRLLGLRRSFLNGDLSLCSQLALMVLALGGQLSMYLQGRHRLKEPCILSRALVQYIDSDCCFQLLKATRYQFMTQLLHQLVCLYEDTKADGARTEIKQLFDALFKDEVTHRLLHNFDPNTLAESLSLIRALVDASRCIGDDAHTAELYRRYRTLIAHRPVHPSNQLHLQMNHGLANLSIAFCHRLLSRATQSQLTDLTEADNQILDAELMLLDELSHGESLPAVALSQIFELTMEIHLARDEVRAAWSKVDELKRLTRQAVSRSISIHIVIGAVCFCVIRNLDGGFTDRDRLSAASHAITALSKAIQLMHSSGSDPIRLAQLRERLAACMEFRQALDKKLAGGDTITQDGAEENFIDERGWAGISASSLTNIRDVTGEHRRSVLELISDGEFDGAIRATQRLYGIGNPAVPPKYDFSLDRAGGRTGVCLLGATKPNRTPRIGPAAFESDSHGLADLTLAITIAHEDMHRRQYRHLPHVDTRRLKADHTDGQLTDEEYSRIVAIQARETHLFESMCYHAETSDIDEIIKQAESTQWNLTDRQRERLRAMRDESAATAQSELAKAELDPALGITDPSQLCDLSTLRSALSSVLRDVPSDYLDHGLACSMTSSFHTGGAALTGAASVPTRHASSIGIDEDDLNHRLQQLDGLHMAACDANHADEPDWGDTDDSQLADAETDESGGVTPINISAGVELTAALAKPPV